MTPKGFDEPAKIDTEEILVRLRLLCELLSAERQMDMNSFKEIQLATPSGLKEYAPAGRFPRETGESTQAPHVFPPKCG